MKRPDNPIHIVQQIMPAIMPRIMQRLAPIALVATLLLPSLGLRAQNIIAVKAGRIITITNADLKDGVVLIEDGKIKAIGSAKDIEVPWDAKVIDASKKVVMPTYVIAHTSGGMSGANERMANVPFVTVQDGIDPSSPFFEEALRNGIGTLHVIPGNDTLIGGAGMVVRPYGKTVEDMAVMAHTGLKLSLASSGSRMAKIQQMRRALQDIKDYVRDYDRRKKEFEEEKKAGATTKKEFEEKIDEKRKPVIDLLNGKERAFLFVPSTAELVEADRIIRDYKLDKNVVLVLGAACHKAAAQIAARGLPVILDDQLEHIERDPETEKEVRHCIAGVLHAAKVKFAFSTAEGVRGMERFPWWQMALGMRDGMSKMAALRAFTIEPAKILGLDSQLGSLEAGKVANLQILTGDPIDATTWVDSVLLNGEVVYERDKDARLQHLFGKEDSNEKTKATTK